MTIPAAQARIDAERMAIREEGRMSYKENPKTKGSGIVAAIPQVGRCPNNCADCFFQSGRSYLEPLSANLPNLPEPEFTEGRIVRVNDGNDSNVERSLAIVATAQYRDRFFNTAIPHDLGGFPAPVVLTVNPGKRTDAGPIHLLDAISPNLMFVRFRTNMWNLVLARETIEHYTAREIPVVLTFMAYYTEDAIPEGYRHSYVFRQRTLNSYYAITSDAWRSVMNMWWDNPWVYSCGKVEGERGKTACARCGNCIREYYVAKERMRQ